MKKFIPFFCILFVAFVGCETEDLSSVTETQESAVEIEDSSLDPDEVDFDEIQSSFLGEVEGLSLDGLDLSIIESADLNEEGFDKGFNISSTRYHSSRPRLTSICLVKDADRCPFEDRQPTSNMWWPESETDFFNPTAYFSSTRYRRLIFATFSNGTALIRGITTMNEGDCKVFVNVWLKNRKTYSEFSDMGGEFKLEPGCASQAADEEEIVYYEINPRRSTITAWGNDCLGTGTFGIEIRSDDRPNGNPDPNVPMFGAQLGINGAAFDSNIGALGFSTWGFVTDRYTKERLWVLDFDFRLWCKVKSRK